MGGSEIKDRLLIAMPGPEPTDLIKHLSKKFPEVEVTVLPLGYYAFGTLEIDPKQFADKTIIMTFDVLPKKLEDAPKLQWVQLPSAGANHINQTPVYKESDITITTAVGIHGPQIAEWVTMTALVHTHRYNELHESQKKHEWKRPGGDNPMVVRDLPGQRLGVLGYGSIGRQVGRVAKAMGMDVIAFTATPKDTPEKKRDTGYIVPGTGDPDGEIPSKWYSGLDKESLHNFLEQDIDVLVVSLPLTKETTHMLGKTEFDILSKKKTFLSNVSRGQVVVQSELVDALKDGRLGGAALDVTDPEPLPKDSPLWDAPNTIVTPHISGSSTKYYERAFEVLELNLERRRDGKPLVNVVNRGRGY